MIINKTFENQVNDSKDKEIYILKKDMAIKIEEIQSLNLENKHLKQQIKQLEEEQEELLNYP